jgi:hypothetical protein
MFSLPSSISPAASPPATPKQEKPSPESVAQIQSMSPTNKTAVNLIHRFEKAAMSKTPDPESIEVIKELPEVLPDTIDGPELRSLSATLLRSNDLHGYRNGKKYDLRSDQQKCHRVPNKLLLHAYNSTTSQQVKKEILAFNYSKQNIFSGTNNSEHSRLEREFDKDAISSTDYRLKADMMDTAIGKALSSGEYTDAFFAHMLGTMSSESKQYKTFVANLDMRHLRSYATAKDVIKQARATLPVASTPPRPTTTPTAATSGSRRDTGLTPEGKIDGRTTVGKALLAQREQQARATPAAVHTPPRPPPTPTAATSGSRRDTGLTPGGKIDGRTTVGKALLAQREQQARAPPPVANTPLRPSLVVQEQQARQAQAQTAHAGYGYSPSQMSSGYRSSNSGSDAGSSRASNSWNSYQHAHAGQGMSRSEMSAGYRASK